MNSHDFNRQSDIMSMLRQKFFLFIISFFSCIALCCMQGCKKNHIEPYQEFINAVSIGHLGQVEFILMNKYPELIASYGSNLYDEPIRLQRFDIVAFLILNNVDANAKINRNGLRPLHFAVQNKYIVQLLLDNGADVNLMDSSGNLPIQLAAQNGDIDTFKILKTHGSYPITVQNEQGDTFLHYAAESMPPSFSFNKKGNMIKFLIENGLNVNSRNKKGQTPLHIASNFCGSDMLVKILLERGANKMIKDNIGKTAMDYAKDAYEKQQDQFRRKDIIDILSTATFGQTLPVK